MTCYQKVHCPSCKSDHIVKSGHTHQGTQRCLCQEDDCATKTFLLDYRYNAYKPEVKKKLIDMAINGSGIRDTSRVLHISKNTVISTLKKNKAALSR